MTSPQLFPYRRGSYRVVLFCSLMSAYYPMRIIPPPYQYITQHPQIFFEETVSYVVNMKKYLIEFGTGYRIAIVPRSIQLYVWPILASVYTLLSYNRPKRVIIVASCAEASEVVIPSEQLKGFDSANGKVIKIDQEALSQWIQQIWTSITISRDDEFFEKYPAISIQIPYLRALTTISSIIPLIVPADMSTWDIWNLLDLRYGVDSDCVVFCANLADGIPFEQAIEQDASTIAASITNHQVWSPVLEVRFPLDYWDCHLIHTAFARSWDTRKSLLRNVMYANTWQVTGQHESVSSYAGFVG